MASSSHLRALLMLAAMATAVGERGPVKWRASKTVMRTVAARPPPDTLESFFSTPEMPRTVIECNPGLASATCMGTLEDGATVWEGRTAPIKFGPFVSVTSIIKLKMRFDATLPSPTLVFEALESRTESDGPPLLVRFIDSILPDVRSKNTVSAAGSTLTSEAFLELDLPMPRWLPVPRAQIEQAGPPILEKQLENDLTALLEKLAELYTSK